MMAFYALTQNTMPLDAADWTGYALCHRLISHSFEINGRPLPLCARCTGMYLGVFMTFVVLWLNGRLTRNDLPQTNHLLALLGLIALMGIDGINSTGHFIPSLPYLYEPQNWLRLLTGLGTGVAMGLIIFPALAQTLWQIEAYRPSIESWYELGETVLLTFVVGGLVLSNQAVILYVMALASTLGLLLIVSALNTVILLLVTGRASRATQWSQAVLPLLIGLTLAVAELMTISSVRYAYTGVMNGVPGLQ